MQNGSRWCFVLFLLGISIDALQAEPNPKITIGVFGQEIAHDLSAAGMPEGPLTALWLDENGQLWLGGAAGVGCWRDGAWQPVAGLPDAPVRAIQGRSGTMFIAYAHEIWQVQPSGASPRVQGFAGTIHALAVTESALYASTSLGVFSEREGHLELDTSLQALMGEANPPLSIACGHQGELAVGGERGLFTQSPGGAWQAHDPASADGKSWAVRQVSGVGYDSAGNLWFCSAQGVGVLSSEWRLYAGPDGLPYAEFTSLTVAPDDTVWFATRLGAIHFDGQEWAYRQGRRWLPHDAVAAIAANARGDAWFATAGGLGQIERRPMTLAEKAAFYEEEMERYIKRTAVGYVSEVALAKPGDKSTVIQSDSDNDGLWTSMYGAGECFAYAATKDPQAKRRAQQAFEALRFLSVAPAQGEVEQQPGFVARTVVPTTEPDPNLRESYTVEGMKRRRQYEDGQWKVYFPRWPKTKDGAYWYKTDTSSDELDGHYFFYPIYYDLVAETPEEKEQVREIVRNLTDHLIRNEFCLVDHDGTPTRWGYYNPSILNQDFNWYVERGLKSLSILSYLTVAQHITGDAAYGRVIDELIQKHHYAINAMVTKMQRGFGSGNQSDDEMAVMCYFNLVRYTPDEHLRKQFLLSFYQYWLLLRREMNPFFHTCYAVCGLNQEYQDSWGTYDLSPWPGWLEDSAATLTGFPLDRVDWRHANSHRLDLILLPPDSEIELDQRTLRKRGYKVNGKVLPVQERHFNHYNHDPWAFDTGGNGHGLASGTVYLLPYYMGLYYGFIE